ncbi:coiled-coil and C2 domain-containing protein 1B-like isoform X1 [Acipenser ruthenus]|uniref:coiled-coil and C2 domain-containing protein 1B-like isoform X1 n=1 Tax=Acipenser ruthenus TaxID=7906 RepID=UPI0027412FDD|nr:coiled-coil and C2 domain-containing protein 1B-like isoform X1 [Acipenser ruthenus]XP_058887583.1 coiled-coil and C2 domain-containing protein 1B-like isoform X1 [Acipenser ruthenus]
MLRRKNKKQPLSKGHGAAAAKQMGLFMDFNPDDMVMDLDGGVDDGDLEAEFAAIMGKRSGERGKPKPKGKTPLPMEDIEKMAENCMRDSDDEDDDEDLENDEDLLAELQDVVGEAEEAENVEMEPTELSVAVETPPAPKTTPSQTDSEPQVPEVTAAPSDVQRTLEERIGMYKTAIINAKASGETSKARRYDRGLKTLETMLTSIRKGKKINEAEIPPPVTTGKIAAPAVVQDSESEAYSEGLPVGVKEPISESEGLAVIERKAEETEEPEPATAPETPVETALPAPEHEVSEADKGIDSIAATDHEATKVLLLGRQKEYKIAALKAKQQGDLDRAKEYMKIGKKFDAVIEALEGGQPIDLSNMPPPPGDVEIRKAATSPSHATGGATEETQPVQATAPMAVSPAAAAPSQPKDVLEALQQRMEKYKEASAQAKTSGEERKARMHDRIAKQYQDAIRAHKAGRTINFAELPVPPGFPPIPGMEGAGAEQGIAAVLEAASKLASDEGKQADEEDEEDEQPLATPQKPKKPMLAVPPTVQGQGSLSLGQPRRPPPSPPPERQSHGEGLSQAAQQQLEFLEGRRKKYMKAAIQAKQKNDLEQAKSFLRTAKGFEPMIEAAKNGKAVDISKVPSPPGDEEDDFILMHHGDVQISQKAEDVYMQLAKILKEQCEKCVSYSKQFTQLGNITETTKFEKMSEDCKKNLEILKLAQAQGLDPPKHHFEKRTYSIVRIFPELSSTELLLIVVKGINLPAPPGIATNDLDAFVKFEFPYPSGEQAQKHKTSVIKNTNCPEYNQSFKLNINRNHRGFRRVIQSKGIKLEVLHKGGFLRSDKPVGTVHLKLEKLETECEVREIVELFDGRKPTGGRLEVRVQLREPLSGQDVQQVTERWLVLEQPKVAS